MKIGDIIRQERIRCGLSQEELAKSIGSTKQAIYKYESGIVSNIPMDKVEIIASRLGVTPSYLTGWQDEDEDEENPHELKLVTAFDKLSVEDQIIVSNWVEEYEKNPAPPITKLSEAEQALINLFRLVPEENRGTVLEKVLVAVVGTQK